MISNGSIRPVTHAKIARKAGVSRSLVSLVLGGSTSLRISEKTRKQIRETAEQLGYQPRFVPVNRFTGLPRTRTVTWIDGAYHPVSSETWLDRSYAFYFQRLFNSVVQSLELHGFTLTVKQYQGEDDVWRWLRESRTEGVLWRKKISKEEHAFIRRISKEFPLVVVNSPRIEEVDQVSVNESDVTRMAAEYLQERGHRRMAYFGHAPGQNIFRIRLQAFEAFLADHHLEPYPEFQEISDDPSISPVSKAKRILEAWEKLEENRPSALILADVFALPLLIEAHSRGIRIPEELSVVGIDNISAAEISHPALTSIDQPLEPLGETAVDLLMKRIAHPQYPPTSLLLTPSLVERQSVAGPCAVVSRTRSTEWSGIHL